MLVVLSLPDMRALAACCHSLGLELVSGQRRFRYSHIQLELLPEWLRDVDRNMLGQLWNDCDHVLRLSPSFSDYTRETSHEIGLYIDKRYRVTAVADLGPGGEALSGRIGLDGGRLLYAYRVEIVNLFVNQYGLEIVDRYVSRNNTFICTLIGEAMTPGNTGGPRKLRIKVYPDGRVELEVLEGFSGPACEAFTQGFVDAVGGRTTSTANKPEYAQITAPVELQESAN